MPVQPNVVVASQGTKLGIGAVPDWVANVTSIDGLDIKQNTIETTALDAAGSFKTFVAGFKEIGDVSVSGYLDTTSQVPFWNAISTAGVQESQAFTIQFPPAGGQVTGTKWEFQGLITGFKTKAGVDSVISFDTTIKVIGMPTLTWGV